MRLKNKLKNKQVILYNKLLKKKKNNNNLKKLKNITKLKKLIHKHLHQMLYLNYLFNFLAILKILIKELCNGQHYKKIHTLMKNVLVDVKTLVILRYNGMEDIVFVKMILIRSNNMVKRIVVVIKEVIGVMLFM